MSFYFLCSLCVIDVSDHLIFAAGTLTLVFNAVGLYCYLVYMPSSRNHGSLLLVITIDYQVLTNLNGYFTFSTVKKFSAHLQ